MSPKNFSDLSMLPLVHPTDKLIITKTNKFNLEDIVVYQQKNSLIAHRVIYKTKNHLITRGDNNIKIDKKIPYNQILGVVHQVKRGRDKISLNHIYFSQSIKYFKIINSLVSKLDKENIPYVFLKGLPIYLYYKKSPPQHLYVDIDMLIRKKHLKKVKKILFDINFNISKTSPYINPRTEPTQYSFFKLDNPANIVIDLHVEPGFGFTKSVHINSLLPNQTKITSHLFSNSHKVMINDKKISILNPETQIILLLMHFYHHNFKKIHKLSIIETINQQKISWKQIFTDINKLKLEPFIEPAIILFDRYYPNIVPNTYVNSIKKFKYHLTARIHSHKTLNSQNQKIAGIHRFFLIIFLSKSSLLKKITIILHKNTFLNFYKVIKSFFTKAPKNSSKSFVA